MRRYSLTVVTDAAGAATATFPKTRGKLNAVGYIKDTGANPYAAGVDFTITNLTTGESIWTQVDQNASAVKRPRYPAHDGLGAALLYAAGGTPQSDKMLLAGDQVKVVLAQGGATKTGTFYIDVEAE